MVTFGNDWDQVLQGEFAKEYYGNLRRFLIQAYDSGTVYPDMYNIFAALQLCSFAETQVVILGQDPYHGPGQAHGLAFSVPVGVRTPPSLYNVYKELADDVGCRIPDNGCLIHWAKQGVLLLNTSLTVAAQRANSHRGKGWENFTDRVISELNEKLSPVVFLLWGNHARAKGQLITNRHHCKLMAAHPSPLSAHKGFFGCRHFSRTNAFLTQHGRVPVDWQIPNADQLEEKKKC